MSLRDELLARSKTPQRVSLDDPSWLGASVQQLTLREQLRYEELAEGGECSDAERRERRIGLLVVLSVVNEDGSFVFQQPSAAPPFGDLDLVRSLPSDVVAVAYNAAQKLSLNDKDKIGEAEKNLESGLCAAGSSSLPGPSSTDPSANSSAA
jgi:hypothetical protein